MEKTNKIFSMLTNVISIIFGILIYLMPTYMKYEGEIAELEQYGGDAYTGMQNVAAITAGNINELGYLLSDAIETILQCVGIMFIVYGTIFLIFNAIRFIQLKKNPEQ